MIESTIVPGHGQGGGQLPPITDPYVTVGGETLPSIAERAGFPGGWQTLALQNIDQVPETDLSDEAKIYVVAERAGRPGTSLTMPPEWNIGAQAKPAESSSTVTPDASMSAAELIDLAAAATTLAELDAIDTAAAGRVTVTAAVDQRRATLLDQGATA